MAVSVPRKKSKKSRSFEIEDGNYPDSFIYRFFSRIPVAFILLLVIFLWSSSTTLLSGSIVHVCVSSRKLNNLYCLSAGTQPGNYTISIPFISNSSKYSVNDFKIPVSSPRNYTQNAVSSPRSHTQNAVSSQKSHSESAVRKSSPSYEAPPTPASVMRDEIILQQSVTSSDKVLSDESGKERESNSIEESSDSSPFVKEIYRRRIDPAKADELANGRKDVESLMGVLRSYISKSKPSSCEKRGIYVYDLPSKFNKDLMLQCTNMMIWDDFCKYFSNNGIGETIPKLGKDWFNTHQYSLEPIFHSHMLKHPCRVYNPEEAKLFYVPYYGGLDILRWHFKNVSNEVKDSLSKELAEWLRLQNPWRRNSGKDHVFVLGKISWDFRRWEKVTWGTRLLELPELQNPIKLLIERQPWQINDVGVPHPSFFHPSSDEDILSWQTHLREVRRKHLISFAGATRKDTNSIRSILISQCISSNSDEICKFFDCKEQACAKPSPVVRLFTESEFCLQPPGDSPTRKSIFDSLIAGCIPVLFDPFSAYYQYPWHLPENHRKYSVYIDQEQVKTGEVNVVETLKKIDWRERIEMRRYIIEELMPRLVYSHPDGKLNKFQDAFSISVNNLIERAVSKLP